MSNSIKDIIKTFKTLQEQEEQPLKEATTVEVVKESVKKTEKKAFEPIVVKAPGAAKVEKPKAEPREPKKTIQMAENPMPKVPIALNDDFFSALMDKDFNNKDRAIAYLEPDVYEIFMSIKRKKKVKNVSILINAVLNQFIEDNKDDIRQLLTNNRL